MSRKSSGRNRRNTNKSKGPYVKPSPPQTDEQLIQQLDMARSFIGTVVRCIRQREHGTAYVLNDRAWELLAQVRTAMEDLEPEDLEPT